MLVADLKSSAVLRARSSGAGWLIAAGWLVAMLIVLRDPIATAFDLGFGDRNDELIAQALLEHWRNVWNGAAQWDRTFYFHPYPGTLGYNDAHLLTGIVYTLARIAFDPFHAATVVQAVFKTAGFLATVGFVRRLLGWQTGVAVFVALLFTIASGIQLQAGHAQLVTIALLPAFLLLAGSAMQAALAGRTGAARLRACAAATLLALWCSTAFYFAWLTLFGGGLFVAAWAWFAGPDALAAVRRHAGTIGLAGGTFVALLIPFLSVYLPKLAETGAHGFAATLPYLTTPFDLVSVGPGNFVWGWLHPLIAMAFGGAGSPGAEWALGGEHRAGWPPLLLTLILAAGHSALRPGQPAALRALAAAVLILWLLTLNLGPWSPWRAVQALAPGAKGMRVVVRVQLFLVLPALLLAAAVWRARLATLWARVPHLAMLAVALLIVEQLSRESPAQIRRSTHIAALAAVPPPPPGCRAFAVRSARAAEPVFRDPVEHARYAHNVDAMWLAERWRTPTINGFSTFNPPDWAFDRPLDPDYLARIGRYAAAHRLTGLCLLDMRAPDPWHALQSG